MKIVCATDMLAKGESAMDRAEMLAHALGADLSLLHVLPPTESRRVQEQDLQRVSDRLKFRAGSALWRYGRQPNVYVRAGNPTRVLLESMKELAPDLIVIGSHREQPAWDALVGTTVGKLLSARQCPVLIVDRWAYGAYRNIVLALDRTKASAETVRVAEALILRDGACATIVHAYQAPYTGMLVSARVAATVVSDYSEGWNQEAETALLALLREASNDLSRYEIVLEPATPTVGIQNVVSRLNPELLIMGTRGYGRLGRALIGSVASRVLATARCDVLVVPDQVVSVKGARARVDRSALDVSIGV